MRTKLSKIAHILLILIIGAIGVQTITSCSGDDGGGDPSSSSRGGSSSPSGSYIPHCDTVAYALLTPCEDGTVTIGDQVWQKCNSNAVPSTGRGSSGCYCNKPENCAIYGRLYDWAASMNFPSSCNNTNECDSQIDSVHQGICPDGFHIPHYRDWYELLSYVDTDSIIFGSGNFNKAGKYLKATSGWNDLDGISGNGEDTYGFSALPGGACGGLCYNVGNVSYWWSASGMIDKPSEQYHLRGYLYMLRTGTTAMKSPLTTYGERSVQMSVRCVKD